MQLNSAVKVKCYTSSVTDNPLVSLNHKVVTVTVI